MQQENVKIIISTFATNHPKRSDYMKTHAIWDQYVHLKTPQNADCVKLHSQIVQVTCHSTVRVHVLSNCLTIKSVVYKHQIQRSFSGVCKCDILTGTKSQTVHQTHQNYKAVLPVCSGGSRHGRTGRPPHPPLTKSRGWSWLREAVCLGHEDEL